MGRFLIFLGGVIFFGALFFYLIIVQPAVQDFENQMAIYGPMVMLGGAEAQAEIQQARTGIAILKIISFGGMGFGGLLAFWGYNKRKRRNHAAADAN